MIIVRLNGGLGNQLFQYAAARRLSLKLAVPLKLDLAAFEGDKLRVFELDAFNIEASIASRDEVDKFGSVGIFQKIKRKLGFETAIIKEKYYHFDPQILNALDGSYLEGYWQSYRYFEDQSAVISRDLTMKKSLSGENKTMSARMNSVDSSCLHIRRGDYVSNQQTNQFHGTCSLAYYQQAVGQLVDKVNEAEIFVFSDDIPWAKENLVFDLPMTFVDHNSAKNAYEDLRLMTACKYFVIANSSFSWWGAWLAQYNTKEVYAPKLWFADQTINTQDLIPPGWHRV